MDKTPYRALIVDDEIAIQNQLVAALAKHGIECDVAGDGAQALQLCGQTTFHLVVTDLKLPKMHGYALALELLQSDRRPLIVVHTDVIEPRIANDLLLRGVDDLVFKPIDCVILATKLKAMVDRSLGTAARSAPCQAVDSVPKEAKSDAGDASDSNVSLAQLTAKLDEISHVMPISSAAIDVYEMTRSCDWDLAQIAAAIQRDASLTTEVMRLANSALYNPAQRRIVQLDEAVLRIGQKRVGEIALTVNALSPLAMEMLPWMDLDLTWKRSMAAGIAIEYLIEQGAFRDIEDGLLLSAIMHPLGRVVLGMMFPTQYATLIERCQASRGALQDHERQMFPVRHAEIMAHLLATWRIPDEVFMPLRFCLDSFTTVGRLPEPLRTKVELVKLAILIGQLAVARWQSWDLVEFPIAHLIKRLRISNIDSIIERTCSDVDRLASFRLEGSQLDQDQVPTKNQRPIPYSNLSGSREDLLASLLPAVGFEPRECAPESLKQSQEMTLLNCLGASIPPPATIYRRKKAVAVVHQSASDAFVRLMPTVTLPSSFALLHDQLVEHLSEADASPTDQSLTCTA